MCLTIPANATLNQILKLPVNHSSVLYILELNIEKLNDLWRNWKSECNTLQISPFTQLMLEFLCWTLSWSRILPKFRLFTVRYLCILNYLFLPILMTSYKCNKTRRISHSLAVDCEVFKKCSPRQAEKSFL